jgi:hypothetical protein
VNAFRPHFRSTHQPDRAVTTPSEDEARAILAFP